MDQSIKYLVILVLCLVSSSEYEADDKHQTILSRKRRYIVFPEGSSFSIALCMTLHTLTSDDIFQEGVNWGISYDLPNESKPALEPFLELRNDKLKTGNKYGHYGSAVAPANRYGALKYSGWNNNVKSRIAPGKKKYGKSEYYYLQRRHRRELYDKLEVIMNALPLKRVFSFEPEEHHTYTQAHKAGHEGKDCAAMFPGCSFSLIDMALGKYNAPPSNHPTGPMDYAETFSTEGELSADWTRYYMK